MNTPQSPLRDALRAGALPLVVVAVDSGQLGLAVGAPFPHPAA
jgi:hypothetical protein